VIAERAFATLPAPPPPEEAAVTGSHASPREHLRAGHARRVAIRTARERLVWVRPTTVRPHAPSALNHHPQPRRGPSQQEPRQGPPVTRATPR
jgi:hypothetical protein